MATTDQTEGRATFDAVVRDRRSVHDYSDEPVDDETLEELFDLVRYAPSSYNLQPWEFLVVREEGNREALREVAYGQEHVTDAPVGVVVLGNTDPAAHADRVVDDLLEKGYRPDRAARDGLLERIEGLRDRDEATNRRWAVRSTALAAMTLMHAARSRGLSTCPMGGFDPEALRETFDVGDEYEPVVLLTLGYPADGAADRENERKYRRPVSEIVHHETFDA
ncbi:nitroreductase family protein [Halomarina halobia]|uniref:Nitroreductase family protein n=1 Tax=Halomarina halobia TaxID=3033386 RepID=A0ABD6A7V3_9EURY|nr:nitroreductase family protein [Halomarina sp. PSR21]